MLKFVLVLTLFGVDGPDISYAVETGLSDSGCLFSLSEVQADLEKIFDKEDFELFCEPDHNIE